MKLYTNVATLVALMVASSLNLTSAILVQPYNYLLDESSLVDQPDAGSLSPFYNDQSGPSEHNADKDIVAIISDRLARIRYARMVEQQQNEAAQQHSGFSQEMDDLIHSEQQASKQDGHQEPSLSSSVANILMNVAQAAGDASSSASSSSSSSASSQQEQSQTGDVARSAVSGNNQEPSRGSIMELDTSASSSGSSMPSKSDLKNGPIQWFNPKESISALKISSMATPSKYKKVYFRSEKKLVDGAFHSVNTEQDEKKSFIKPFSSGVQRRSSRGTTSSGAPPGILQDGVIDFLRKFRDVYIQTRPVSASGSAASNLASSVVSAAASSPLAAVLAPSSASGSRPNLASAISAATSMVNSAASVAQAASSSQSSSSSLSSSPTGGAGSLSPIKSPISAQSYVSFWSKTFPTWVRKMLKQMRRRSLYNSKRHQNQSLQHSAASVMGHATQAAASGALASVVEGSSSGSAQPSSH